MSVPMFITEKILFVEPFVAIFVKTKTGRPGLVWVVGGKAHRLLAPLPWLWLFAWRVREARRWARDPEAGIPGAPMWVAVAWALFPERLENSGYWWVLPHQMEY